MGSERAWQLQVVDTLSNAVEQKAEKNSLFKKGSFRLPKQYKLKNRDEISKPIKQGMLKKNNTFTLFYINNTKKFSRLGIIISKRFVNHAVERNKIRRIIKEVFRVQRQQLNSTDFVFIARKDCDKKSKVTLHTKTTELFNKAKNA